MGSPPGSTLAPRLPHPLGSVTQESGCGHLGVPHPLGGMLLDIGSKTVDLGLRDMWVMLVGW